VFNPAGALKNLGALWWVLAASLLACCAVLNYIWR
jgi:hypothetical protein